MIEEVVERKLSKVWSAECRHCILVHDPLRRQEVAQTRPVSPQQLLHATKVVSKLTNMITHIKHFAPPLIPECTQIQIPIIVDVSEKASDIIFNLQLKCWWYSLGASISSKCLKIQLKCCNSVPLNYWRFNASAKCGKRLWFSWIMINIHKVFMNIVNL